MSDPIQQPEVEIYPQVPPEAPEEAQLTEEDIIKMKEQNTSMQANTSGDASDGADPSIISLADSASNFDEHVGDDYDEMDSPDGEELDQHDKSFNGWLFARPRTDDPELPTTGTVSVLDFPPEKQIPPCPEGVDEEDWDAAFRAAKVYLIGTAHFSRESQEDVINTIRAVQPDVVMVELCPSRISILSLDEQTLLKEASELTVEKMCNIVKQSGAVQGVLHVMLLSMSAHITRQLSMAPGGEFRAAHRAVMQTQLCRLVLGDRPIHITLQRALGALNFWQKIKFFFHVCFSHFTTITPEEVERCKRQDLLEELLAEMAGDFPKLSEIFVQERDQYMTYSLQHILTTNTEQKYHSWRHLQEQADWQPLRVVAVVGIGHTPGIVANWTGQVDIAELIRIPPPSRTAQVVRYTIKGAVYLGLGYLLWRGGSRVARRFVKF